MIEGGGGGIFVSYRRKETSHLAGRRLYDRLADRFGEGQVFMDVDAIEPGVDFAEEISRAVAACRVLLVIIGPTWLTAADERGHRRLDDPDDLVRLEVEAALTRGVRVIPILTEGAVMPARHDLPESLTGLARRNALTVRHESFRSDAGRLITAIERVLASDTAETSPVSGARGPRPAEHESTKAGRISESAHDTADSPASLPTDAGRIVSSIGDSRQKSAVLNEGILARRRRVLGEDHPKTLSAATDLANDLRNLGEYQDARELDEDTLARRRRVLGEDHPDTLTSASNLARDLSNLGMHQNARAGRRYFVMDADGNLVIRTDEGKPIWVSRTDELRAGQKLAVGQSRHSFAGRYTLDMQDNGNLVIRTDEGKLIWACNTATS